MPLFSIILLFIKIIEAKSSAIPVALLMNGTSATPGEDKLHICII